MAHDVTPHARLPSQDAWSRIARQYLAHVDAAPYNALYERPAMLAMLSGVRGKRVLDLGCGSGFYLDHALVHGAVSATGIDRSAEMIDACARRTGGKAVLVQADLQAPLTYLANCCADLAIASLVVHYLLDLPLFGRELWRVLTPGGTLLVSTSHPLADFRLSPSGDYFSVEEISEEWSSYGMMMLSYRHPLSELVGSFTKAGFVLSELVEPQPLDRMADAYPETYRKLLRSPGFICLRLQKPA